MNNNNNNIFLNIVLNKYPHQISLQMLFQNNQTVIKFMDLLTNLNQI